MNQPRYQFFFQHGCLYFEPARVYYIQLFRQRLSHKSVKDYATMPLSIMGSTSLALLDSGSRYR